MDSNADAGSIQSPSVSVSVTKCANCCAQFLTADGKLGAYAAENGTIRSIYEGLELLLKSRQSIPQAELDSQRLNLCIPCGTPFAKLMALYSAFFERSHPDSHVRNVQKEVSNQFSSTARKRKPRTKGRRCPAPSSTLEPSSGLPQTTQQTGTLPVSVILPQFSHLPLIIFPEHLPTSIPDIVSQPETIVPDCVVGENFDDVAKHEQQEITENDDVDDSYSFLESLGSSVEQKPATLPATTLPRRSNRKPAATAKRNKILKISSGDKKNPTTPLTNSNLRNKARILRRKLLQTTKDDSDSNKQHSGNVDPDLGKRVRRANAVGTRAYEREKRKTAVCSETDCTQRFATQTLLDRHKTIEHGARYPVIPSELRYHLEDLTDEQKALIDSSRYKCNGDDCKDVNFDTFKEWVVHQEKDHKLNTGYKDIEKSAVLFPKAKLIRPCPLCGKTYDTTTYIIQHIKCKHFKVRNYTCDICGKALTTKDGLEHHMKVLHSDTPLVKEFLCTYCGAAFTTKGGLTLHENTHLDVVLNLKTVTCETCGMAFSSKIFLKKHQFVHTEERNFSCDQCQKTFKAAHHLRGHVYRVHQKSQIRDQVCEICGNAFAFKSALKEHYMYTHKMTKEEATVAAKMRRPTIFRVLPNGDRVYKEIKASTPTCSICNRVYMRRLNLCTHLMSQHGKTEEEARAITGYKSNRKLTRSPTTVGARTRRKRKVTETAAVQKEVSEDELSSSSPGTSDESEDEKEEGTQMDFDVNMLT